MYNCLLYHLKAWCAMANCYSLQKEHEQAIKYLQRAIQVTLHYYNNTANNLFHSY